MSKKTTTTGCEVDRQPTGRGDKARASGTITTTITTSKFVLAQAIDWWSTVKVDAFDGESGERALAFK
ncbi:MAG: hypothetical protein DWQ31_09500 [Planctomycetota bacterium]|nr:MAG: hypothetical protein DWQ31_09500 [Planctomycetota bacterium]REJ97844.1 MAG: hypothetical protein DWQ35_01155 [Planctomycetota bacterium]